MTILTVLMTVGIVAVVSMAFAPHGPEETRPEESPAGQPPVFACRPGALTPEERVQHNEARARLERGTQEVTEDAGGYTFHYAADIPPAAVIAWVEKERKCCPFLRFTLDVPEDGGSARLRIWGEPGVKAFIAAELK